MPKVSVIIPTYNRAKYIRESIDSVLAQTYQDYEIIVVDDGSTDNTKEIILSYGDKVRYFFQDHGNQPLALNFGATKARGEYIAFLDDDDLWVPNKLELQVNILDSKEEIGFVCSETYHMNESGETTHHWKRKDWNKDTFESLYENNFICHCVVLVRKQLLDQVGGFDGTLITTQDYDLWLRLTKICKFEYINKPLARIRFHPNNKHKNRIQKLKDRVYVVSKPENMTHLNFIQKRARIAREYYSHAEYFKDLGFWGLASWTYFRAIIIYPAIGCQFLPEGAGKLQSSWPYRLFRPYIQVFYWLGKELSKKRPHETNH